MRRLKKPIPLNQELRVVGRMTKETSRTFEGSGEILLSNGEVAAIGTGTYMRMPLSKISDFVAEEQEWKVIPLAEDPAEVETNS